MKSINVGTVRFEAKRANVHLVFEMSAAKAQEDEGLYLTRFIERTLRSSFFAAED